MARPHRTHQTQPALAMNPDDHPGTSGDHVPPGRGHAITIDVCQDCGAWKDDDLAKPCTGNNRAQG